MAEGYDISGNASNSGGAEAGEEEEEEVSLLVMEPTKGMRRHERVLEEAQQTALRLFTQVKIWPRLKIATNASFSDGVVLEMALRELEVGAGWLDMNKKRAVAGQIRHELTEKRNTARKKVKKAIGKSARDEMQD